MRARNGEACTDEPDLRSVGTVARCAADNNRAGNGKPTAWLEARTKLVAC